MDRIGKLKREINILRNKLSTQISADEKQKISDIIELKKREIEKISRSEKLVIPVAGKKVNQRKPITSSTYTNNRVIL